MAVGEGQVPGLKHEWLVGPLRIDHLNGMQPFGCTAPLGACIHHNGPANGARDPHRPFEAMQPLASHFAGQGWNRFSRPGFHPALAGIQLAALEAPLAKGEAWQAPIADQ